MKKEEIPVLSELYNPEDKWQQGRIARARVIMDRLNAMSDFDKSMLAFDLKNLDAEALEAPHPDARDYSMFHLVIGSTPDSSTPPKYFDFPKGESLFETLEALAGKEFFDVSTRTVTIDQPKASDKAA